MFKQIKIVSIIAFLLVSTLIHAQNLTNEIVWDGVYKLQLSDFKSPSSQIGGVNMYSLHTSSNMSFSLGAMTVGSFMFKKNFNSQVTCNFKRNSASLIAPDSTTAIKVLDFGRYEFDLSELYARKLRKRLYEAKGAFSDPNFMQIHFNQVQEEFVEVHGKAAKETDIGLKSEKLREFHEQVLQEITLLDDFCKTCKPSKRKKKKKNKK